MNKLISELTTLKNNLDNLPSEEISNINLEKTQLYIIDMNNGFSKSGALYSPRINNLIKPIYDFSMYISKKVHNIIAFTDSHPINCLEFSTYPSHCLENDYESEIIDELKNINNLKILPKNSTNGFFALDSLDFSNIENIIVVGNCTDICVYQFAVTLKSYFIQNNINKNIIIPMNLIETYDAPGVHCADLSNIVFINSMIQNGIKVIKEFIIN